MLAVMNDAEMNIGVKISLQDPDFISLAIYVETGLRDHQVVLFIKVIIIHKVVLFYIF